MLLDNKKVFLFAVAIFANFASVVGGRGQEYRVEERELGQKNYEEEEDGKLVPHR